MFLKAIHFVKSVCTIFSLWKQDPPHQTFPKKILLNLSLPFLITVCKISYFKICLWLFSFVITGKLGLVSISFFGNSRTTGLYIIGWVMLRGSITEHFGGNYDRKCSLHKRRGLSLIIILLLIQAYVHVRKQGEGKSELVVELPLIIIKFSVTYMNSLCQLGLLMKALRVADFSWT